MIHYARDFSRYPGDVQEYVSLGEFLSSPPPEGLVSIAYGGGRLDLWHDYRGSDTTIVSFHAAVGMRRRQTYPKFTGVGLTKGLNANIIFVSDPSLILGLDLAWFAGNRDQPLQRDLPVVLNHLMSRNASQNKIFFGLSGGGFAALYYSFLFPGSLALPGNPQTMIKNHVPAKVEAFAKLAWGVDHISKIPAGTSLVDLYNFGFPNTVGYLQNINDHQHRSQQLLRFLNQIEESPERFYLRLESWDRGHTPPPKEVLVSVLESCVASGGNWGQALLKNAFVKSPNRSYVGETFNQLRERRRAAEA